MSAPHVQELADAIRAYRIKLGMHTQKSLAARMGVNAKTVQNLENGSRDRYAVSTLEALDDALGWERGSALRLLQSGEPPKPIERTSGPAYLSKLLTDRAHELHVSLPALHEAIGGQSTYERLLDGELPAVEASTNLELLLLWEPGTLARVLSGQEPRTLPASVAGSSSCNLMDGAAETSAAARNVAVAMAAAERFDTNAIKELDTQSRMFALAWLLGFEIGDFDLLNGRQYLAVIRALQATFEERVSQMQTTDPRYFNEPTPAGPTRAEIDAELTRGGTVQDAIRRLTSRTEETAPPRHLAAIALLPQQEEPQAPDFSRMAAQMNSDPIEEDNLYT